MLTFGLIALVAFAGGFGVGRIKNAAKLAAAKAIITNVEGTVSADAASVVAKIKAVL